LKLALTHTPDPDRPTTRGPNLNRPTGRGFFLKGGTNLNPDPNR